MVGREHMLSKSRGSYVSVLQSPAVFTKTMVQGPTCLANVGAGAFSTWDAVHHTFPAIGRYWVLGVHKLLPQGPVGTECNLDGQGGQDPTNGLGQSTDVGESHRSTGHLVNILPQEARAVKELAKDDDIVILPADKGRATVVMDRKDYSAKMLTMLGDRDTYQLMAKDPTTSLENRMNSVLLRLQREDRLSSKTYYHLRSSAAGVPRLYGLPKVHKPDVPLRPIVSFVSSPTYALSKFLASLLSPIVGLSDSHVRNSQPFAQFITTQNVSDSEVLVSFDVVSLFTRVPTSRAIQVTRDRLMNDPSLPDRTSLTVDDICSLLQLCLEATYLAFEGKVYRQIHGTAMGSPVSVVVANLVMEDVEQEALSTFHTPPRFWRRYVDDTCTALPSNLVDSFHDHLNSIDPCIQFTIERESNGQLPFLDILLNREEDGSISTSVYRKATHTD